VSAASVPPLQKERFDVVGEMDEPDRRRELGGAGLARDAASVPPFEGLHQRPADVRAEIEPGSQLAGRLAVRLHDLLGRAARGEDELPDHPGPSQRGAAAAQVPGGEQRHGQPSEIVVMGVGVEIGLVAEQGGHLAGLDRTPDPAEQRRVVRGRSSLARNAERFSQSKRHHRLAEHSLHRATHPEVEHE
jgi:hypothetical protein